MMNSLPKKIIIGIFLIALFGELLWAMVYIGGNSKKKPIEKIAKTTSEEKQSGFNQDQDVTESIPEINFSLTPNNGQIKVGEIFPVTVNIDAKENTVSGADMDLLYDPLMLSPQEEISVGTIFPDYPLIKINSQKGKITITGTMTSSGQKDFKGKGIFATIRFKALSEGTTKLKFDFMKGATADSNIVDKETGKDLLERVIDGSYTLIK